jgi:acetyl-CoA synthetase
MITPLPGATPTKPGTATLPFFGVVPEVVDDQGKPVPRNTGGKLVIRKPWPSMLRGLWGDPERYKERLLAGDRAQLFHRRLYLH